MTIQMTNEQFAVWIAKQEAPQLQDETAERVYKWLESKKGSPQDTPAIEDRLKTINKEIKEREEEIANAILRHKVWTGQVG